MRNHRCCSTSPEVWRQSFAGKHKPYTAVPSAVPPTYTLPPASPLALYRTDLAGTLSLDTVGYANVALAAGCNLIANPFDNGMGNLVTDLLASSLPNGTRVCKFSAGVWSSLTFAGGLWTGDLALALAPGEGVFVRLPSGGSATVTFLGNVVNGTPSLTLLNSLLAPPLAVGKLGLRSLSIPATAALLLQQRLPAGGLKITLPNNGDQSLPTAALPLDSKGKSANNLLGQTITLSLNVRLDANLLNFPLPARFCTQGTLPGPDGLSGTSDDTLVAGDFKMFTIPASVLTALSDAGLGILDGTVRGLLELANRGLAGLPTGGASLPEINAAVDAINRGFAECRVLVDCVTHVPLSLSATERIPAAVLPWAGRSGSACHWGEHPIAPPRVARVG